MNANYKINISEYIAPVVIVLAPFIIPYFSLKFDVSSLLTVISILFTILSGFFIAAATSNYLRLQQLISDLNAGMISLFDIVRIISPGSKEKVADAIDEYIISTLDHDLLDFAEKSEKEFLRVIAEVDKVKPTNKAMEALLQNLHTEKIELYTDHQEMSVAAKTIVGVRHWTILIILALLVATLSLTLRDGSFLASIIVSTLLFATYQILTLLREIDTNLFLAKKLAFQTPQQVFRMIGRLPYYPKYALEIINVPEKTYRMGTYVKPGKSFEKKITVVRLK